MKKTHSFVLLYMAIMYFPALRNTIIKISETDPSHRPVDLIVKLIDIIKSKVNPEEGITLEPTIENNNLNRRKFMNVLAKSKNSLKMYQSGLELLKICKHENLSKEITDGINYYIEKNPDLEQYIYPVKPEDIVAGFIYKTPFFFDLPPIVTD